MRSVLKCGVRSAECGRRSGLKCGVRSAECGIEGMASKRDLGVRPSHRHSAFRIPHSALPSWFPRSPRHRGHERVERLGREAQRLPLLGAHVSRHQELDDLEAVKLLMTAYM